MPPPTHEMLGIRGNHSPNNKSKPNQKNLLFSPVLWAVTIIACLNCYQWHPTPQCPLPPMFLYILEFGKPLDETLLKTFFLPVRAEFRSGKTQHRAFKDMVHSWRGAISNETRYCSVGFKRQKVDDSPKYLLNKGQQISRLGKWCMSNKNLCLDHSTYSWQSNNPSLQINYRFALSFTDIRIFIWMRVYISSVSFSYLHPKPKRGQLPYHIARPDKKQKMRRRYNGL